MRKWKKEHNRRIKWIKNHTKEPSWKKIFVCFLFNFRSP